VPFPAIRYKFSFSTLFSNASTGASAGRSVAARKNRLLNFEALHYYLGQKELKD